jgi:N-methylhydantoinase A
MALDRAAAETAIRDGVAKPLGWRRCARLGASTTSSARTSRAPSASTPANAGFDYRSGSMVAFGGSGPLHAMAIARKLKIPRVVFPVGAGVNVGARAADQPAGVRAGSLAAASTSPTSMPADFAASFEALESEPNPTC